MNGHNPDRETTNHFAEASRRAVPARVAERAPVVSVSTDAETYAPGEAIEFTVAIRNRLPVPVEVSTADRRVWSWAVNGFEEASDEKRHVAAVTNVLELRGLETKRFTRRWDGRVRRSDGVDGLAQWVPLARDTHRLRAWLHTDVTNRVVEDEIEFVVE